jgi:hypothetical protein
MDAAFGAAGGGGGGGLLGSLIGGATSLFGGSGFQNLFATGNIGGVTSNIVGGPGGFAGLDQAFAAGGSYQAGQPRIVGEKGPELDIPNSSGTILNKAQIGQLLGVSNNDNSPVMINQTVHFGSDVTPQTMARWAETVKQQSITGAIAGVAASRSRGGAMKQVFKK